MLRAVRYCRGGAIRGHIQGELYEVAARPHNRESSRGCASLEGNASHGVMRASEVEIDGGKDNAAHRRVLGDFP